MLTYVSGPLKCSSLFDARQTGIVTGVASLIEQQQKHSPVPVSANKDKPSERSRRAVFGPQAQAGQDKEEEISCFLSYPVSAPADTY